MLVGNTVLASRQPGYLTLDSPNLRYEGSHVLDGQPVRKPLPPDQRAIVDGAIHPRLTKDWYGARPTRHAQAVPAEPKSAEAVLKRRGSRDAPFIQWSHL
jgi:hypothetical protein